MNHHRQIQRLLLVLVILQPVVPQHHHNYVNRLIRHYQSATTISPALREKIDRVFSVYSPLPYNNRELLISSRSSTNCPFDICENVDDYPEDKVGNILRKETSLKSFSGTIVEPSRSFTKPLSSRIGGDEPNNYTLCSFSTRTRVPLKIRDTGGKMQFILNSLRAEEFQQRILYEECEYPGLNTNHCQDNLSGGTKVECVQEFHTVTMATLGDDNGLAFGRFPLPSYCRAAFVQNRIDY